MDIKEIIESLNLKPLPEEGGYYRETYRSSGMIPAEYISKRHQGPRNFSTLIYYLITPEDFSALHILPQDELFLFHLGDPVEFLQIDSLGKIGKFTLGPRFDRGQHLQILVPGGTWQGARILEGGRWSLMATLVSPGFDFKDFQGGSREELLQLFPQHENEIIKFTRVH